MKMKWNTLLLMSVATVIITSSAEFATTSGEVQTNCVKRHLRLRDSEAYAGSLFIYKIPPEVFTGEISEYRVSEACEDTLPAWLTFDFNNRTFKGLPQAGDVGLVHICVKAVGDRSATDGTVCSAKDVFSIDVKIELPPSFILPEEEYIIAGNILVDVTLSQLPQADLFNILYSLGTFLQIPEDSIRLVPTERGDSLHQELIHFQVGCSSDEVNAGHRLVNFSMEAYKSGELSTLVGYPVTELNVTNCFHVGNRPCHAGSDVCRMPGVSSTEATSEPSASVPTTEAFTTDVSTLSVSVAWEVYHEPKVTRLVVIAGKVWIYKIPEDTFAYFKDGSTSNLHLTFPEEKQDVPSWIHFNSESQTLTALPFDNDISKYMFFLEATDKDGASATKRIELIVRPHIKSRRLNHEFIITLIDNSHTSQGVTWQTQALNNLAHELGHKDASFILVKSITFNPSSIVWLNEDLILEPCPVNEIRKFYSTLASEDGMPKEAIKNLMMPEFQIQKIELKFTGTCLSTATPPKQVENFAPILRNTIDVVDVTVGEVFRFKIPDDVFYDLEDGNTRSLLLTLHNLDSSELSESSWLRFDSRNQEILAIAGEENVGQDTYVLEATDSGGSSASATFVLRVSITEVWRNPPVKFSISIDENFSDIRKKVLLVEKLSGLYGDDSSQHLMILNIIESSEVFSWTNTTLVRESCPMDEIRELSKFLIDDDCHPTTALRKAMEPEFTVTKVNITLASACATHSDADDIVKTSSDLDTPSLQDNLSSMKPSKSSVIYNCKEYKLQPSSDALNATDMGNTEEAVEIPPRESNNQPTVRNRMHRFRLTAGKMWIYEIPEDIFEDFEDGNTRNLTLQLSTREHGAVTLDSWIHLDSETQVLLACPLEEHISRYEYVLKATDSEGSAVEESVNVFVVQHHFSRRFNNEFTVTLKYNKRHYPANVDWQIQFVEKLARIIGHNDVNLITLKSITFNPVKITWVNDNLLMPSCPSENIRNIYSRLASENGTPKKEVTDLMLPEFRILKVELRLSGNCEQHVYP